MTTPRHFVYTEDMNKSLIQQQDTIQEKPTKKPYKQADKNYKRFAKHLINSGNITKAYQATYPAANASTARKRGHELVKSEPRVYNALIKEFEVKGIKPSWLATQVKTLAKASRKIEYNSEGKPIKISDNTVRLEAVKTALKVCGYLQSGIQITQDNRQITIASEQLDHRQLKALSIKLNALHRTLNFSGEVQSGEVLDVDVSQGDDTEGIDDDEVARMMDEDGEVDGVGETDSGSAGGKD